MQFTWDNEIAILQGLVVEKVKDATKKQTMKLFHPNQGTYTLMMTAVIENDQLLVSKLQ